MSHKVRTHTRRVNGKTVTVRQHRQEDPAAAQRKRHTFERRVQREQQQAAATALKERQQTEALYAPPGTRTATRTPGERKRRKKNGWHAGERPREESPQALAPPQGTRRGTRARRPGMGGRARDQARRIEGTQDLPAVA